MARIAILDEAGMVTNIVVGAPEKMEAIFGKDSWRELPGDSLAAIGDQVSKGGAITKPVPVDVVVPSETVTVTLPREKAEALVKIGALPEDVLAAK